MPLKASCCFETRGPSHTHSPSLCSLLLLVVDHGGLLLGILNLVLHGVVLVDRELDLALILQLRQHHQRLVTVAAVDQAADVTDLLLSLHGLLHLVDAESVVHVLLGAVLHGFQLLEVDHGGLHVELLLLQLHSHQLVLHLHELVWIGDHAKLLILRIVATTLESVHHQVHLWVHVVHALSWEAHLVLHHHAWELVHVLHSIHSHWSRHLVVHTVVLTHLLASWGALGSPQFLITVSIRALVTKFAVSSY